MKVIEELLVVNLVCVTSGGLGSGVVSVDGVCVGVGRLWEVGKRRGAWCGCVFVWGPVLTSWPL